MNFDLSVTPYSIRGSDLAVLDKEGLKVYSAIQKGRKAFLEIFFYKDGKRVYPSFSVEIDGILAREGKDTCEICFYKKSSIMVRTKGLDLAFIPSGWTNTSLFGTYSMQHANGHYYTVSCNENYFITYYFYKGKGEFGIKSKCPLLATRKPKNCFYVNGDADFYMGLGEEQLLFDKEGFDMGKAKLSLRANWQAFLQKMPSVPEKYREFAEMTWFTLWLNMAPKSRHFTSDTVLMGKVGMPAIWSWDHCFNALATDYFSLETGLNQFFLPYHYQFENGSLPDAFSNSHFFIGIMKPPIHGWCFSKLMERHPDMPVELLEKAYDALYRQAEFWMNLRDSDGDGIPDYPQGCDSGLDNSTVFLDLNNRKKFRRFVECPDLPSYLILQYDALAKISKKLGKDDTEFVSKKEGLLNNLIQHLWQDDRFCSMHTFDHEINTFSHCVIDLMPLVLGNILPKEYFDKTVEKLKRENLTKYGVASESPNSKYYRAEGYWQGPIWAPTTYLIIDGLRRAGETELAEDLTYRYLDMVVNVAKGNYENYDALSGKGLCVKGHTWTASVTILLMHELVKN